MPTLTINLPLTGGTLYIIKLSQDDLNIIMSDRLGFWEVTEMGEEKYCLCSADVSSAMIEDEDENQIEEIDLNDLDDNDIGVVAEDYSRDGIYAVMYQTEIGSFGRIDIDAEEFDPDKLRVEYVSLDELGYEVQLITDVYYNDKKLDVDRNDLSTTGKYLQYKIVETNEYGQSIGTLFDSEDS